MAAVGAMAAVTAVAALVALAAMPAVVAIFNFFLNLDAVAVTLAPALAFNAA